MRHVDLRLYFDILPDPSKASSLEILHDPHLSVKEIQLGTVRTVTIFLKYFDATKQTLFGIGKLCVPGAKKVGHLGPIIRERMKWAPWTPLKFYEVISVAHFYQYGVPIIPLPQEVKPGMIELMKLKRTLLQSEIQDGDIICFQDEISEQEARGLESNGLCSDPVQFYDFLQNRVTVLFRPKFDEPGPDQPEFSLTLSKKQNYDTVGYHPFIDSALRERF